MIKLVGEEVQTLLGEEGVLDKQILLKGKPSLVKGGKANLCVSPVPILLNRLSVTGGLKTNLSIRINRFKVCLCNKIFSNSQ
ncbi:MAG: hypothetical protein EOP34_06040 [Rickettsiales bacterium]|nr:MAG: hypothetical protein EOP34_06040 [Rickettsiales bacterium]